MSLANAARPILERSPFYWIIMARAASVSSWVAESGESMVHAAHRTPNFAEPLTARLKN